MSKHLIATLIFSAFLASCSKTNTASDNSKYRNTIVLGAYSDMTSEPTLDEALLQDLPRVVDLSSDMTPVKNQGDRGTCTFFSTLAMIEGAIKKDMKVEVNLSEEYLNYATKKMGKFSTTEGSTPQSNAAAVTYKGLMLEEDWGYQPSWFAKGFPCEKYENTNPFANPICYTHNKPNARAMSRLIDAKHVAIYSIQKNTNDIIRFLAEHKRPLIMSVNTNFNGWPNSGETQFNEELRQQCLNGESDCGGHSVLVTGYDMDKRVFMFKNSWGSQWGKNGYGTITFDTVDLYTNEELYYTIIEEDLKFPEEKSPELVLNKFDASYVKNDDKSIEVSLNVDVSETSGKMLYISSFLMKKSKNYEKEIPTDGNTELIRITDKEEAKLAGDEIVRTMYNLVPAEFNSFVIEGDSLVIPANLMSAPTVDNIVNGNDFDKVLRTTLYVHTDDSTFKVLKRIYTPVK